MLEQLFAGRVLALDRDAIPRLARRAALVVGGTSIEKVRRKAVTAADAPGARAPMRQVGSTAVISISGVITSDGFMAWLFGGITPDAIAAAVRQAVADPSVRDILLVVDSPGGDVDFCTETAAVIRQARAVKPITALARPLIASAAYWLASQANTIVATPSATVGSVGVYMVHEDQSGFNARVGVIPTYIASDPKKVELNGDEPLSDDAAAFLQSQVDRTYATFVSDIALGRKISEQTVRTTYGSGRAFDANEALRRRMVDRVAPLEAVLGPAGSSSRAARSIAGTHSGDAAQRAVEEEHALIAAIINAPA